MQKTVSIKHETLQRFRKVRAKTEDLCSPLKTEDYIPQADLFTSPPKWHLAHTTWFYEDVILRNNMEDYRPFNDDFSFLFNSYYNNLGDRIPRDHRGLITRPGVREVYDYREYVNDKIEKLINRKPDNKKINKLLLLGTQHEQQHQELLITDLKYTLFQNPIYPIYKEGMPLCENKNKDVKNDIKIDEGVHEIGYQGNEFHYDNEKEVHKVYLHDFTIENNLVTNGAYIKFIEDGGYKSFEYWLDDALAWRNENKVNHPLYWVKKEGKWFQYTLAGLREINPEDIICHINYYEAAAYAKWKGMRLPTEYEWEVAAEKLDWGNRWEWTNSAYLPYPGFKEADGAIGEYNGKFMVNQKVLRGASTATAENHSRKTYRNFFHPRYRWQYTGIRLAHQR